MGVSVRELGLSDQTGLVELLDAVRPGWTDGLAPGASGPLAFLVDGRTFVFGGYVEDEPVGWAWGTHLRRPTGSQMTYLHDVDVVEGHRRRGIGTLLVEAALSTARRAGSERLWLVAEADDKRAEAFYRHLGSAPVAAGDLQRLHRWDLS